MNSKEEDDESLFKGRREQLVEEDHTIVEEKEQIPPEYDLAFFTEEDEETLQILVELSVEEDKL